MLMTIRAGVGAAALALLLAACGTPDEGNGDAAGAGPLQEAPGELVIETLAEGDGATVGAGDVAVVHYTGWLFSPGAAGNQGAQFDSSVERDEPFRFPVGDGRVIAGWDQGVEGMRVGERRRLIIPPELGYGERGAGGVIPGNATLVFEVELLDID